MTADFSADARRRAASKGSKATDFVFEVGGGPHLPRGRGTDVGMNAGEEQDVPRRPARRTSPTSTGRQDRGLHRHGQRDQGEGPSAAHRRVGLRDQRVPDPARAAPGDPGQAAGRQDILGRPAFRALAVKAAADNATLDHARRRGDRAGRGDAGRLQALARSPGRRSRGVPRRDAASPWSR